MTVRRSRTLSRKALRLALRDERADPELREALLKAQLARPKRRADCEGGARPCIWFSCRWNLMYDVTPAGGLQENFPGRELEKLRETCALDVADRGGMTLERVGELLHVVRERVRQIESQALVKLARRLRGAQP